MNAHRTNWLWMTLPVAWLAIQAGIITAQDERKLEAKARIVQINPETQQIILRTKADKKLVVFADDQTKLRLNDRLVRLKELKEGAEVAIVYQEVGQKNMLSALTVVATPKEGGPIQESPSKGAVGVIRAPKEITIKGVIVKVLPSNNEFIVRAPDGSEQDLYLESKNGSVADLQEGAEVTVTYQVRNLVVKVNEANGKVPVVVAPAATTGAAAGFTTAEGTLFRSVSDDNFFILNTPQGLQVFFVDRDTRLRFKDKNMRMNNLKAGTPLSVQFKSANGRNMVSSMGPGSASKAAQPATPKPKPK